MHRTPSNPQRLVGSPANPGRRVSADSGEVTHARRTKPRPAVHRLRFSHEAGGDRAGHAGPGLADVCLPTMQARSAAHDRQRRDGSVGGAKRVRPSYLRTMDQTCLPATLPVSNAVQKSPATSRAILRRHRRAGILSICRGHLGKKTTERLAGFRGKIAIQRANLMRLGHERLERRLCEFGLNFDRLVDRLHA